MHSESPINREVLKKIWFLDDKGLNPEQIAIELKLIYGNHIISNVRDLLSKTVMDSWSSIMYKFNVKFIDS